MADFSFDVCVIGSGAGGGPVAWYLSQLGFSVVVIERGWWLSTQHFRKDEIGACRRDLYVPHTWEFPHQVTIDKETSTTFQLGISFWNATLVGGATNIMSGMFHRMKPSDFKIPEYYIYPQDSTIDSWPISYDDLEPFYTAVESIAGISGKAIKHKFAEYRSTPDFPYPPLKENAFVKYLDEAAKALGWDLVPTPRAIISIPAGERNACYYSGYCGSYGCASDAKSSSRVAFLNPALETGNLQIIPGAIAYYLESVGHRIAKSWIVTAEGKRYTITARVFVVACGPIETCRLLLLSRNRYYPYGIGNHSGQLGKHLIFSSGSVGVGLLLKEDFSPEEWEAIRQPGLWINRTLYEFYEIPGSGSKNIKGGIVEFMFEHTNPIRRAVLLKYDDQGNLIWGKPLQQKLKYHFENVRLVRFEVFADWTPTSQCFVTLSRTVRDKLGLPVAHIHIYQHPHDKKVDRLLTEKARMLLAKAGCKHIQTYTSKYPPPNLVAGGCRMGEDPSKSVTGPDCRVHFVDNLFITDASTFVTGGSVPYTWTIYANALRVAHIIAKNYL